MPLDRWQPRRNGDGDRDSAPASRSSANDSGRYGESSRAPQRSRYSPGPDREEDRTDYPNKARRLDDRTERRFDTAADRRNDRDDSTAIASSSRRTDNARDAAPPALTIRGIASTQRGSSPASQQPAKGDDDRPRRARSPDLFDRLSRRRDETNGSSRPRPESSLRSRLEGEISRVEASEPPRRGATKLAPRGQYDDDGRRVDDDAGPADTRDRHRGLSARDDIPTSPRKRDTDSRRYRDRSSSPLPDRPRYRAADEQDTRYRGDRSSRTERTRTSQRSPSPTSANASRSGWDRSIDRYDRYQRRRSPPPRSSDRYATDTRTTSSTDTPRSARWRAHPDDDPSSRSQTREDHGSMARRLRSPSPTRSDTSTRSRRRDRDEEPSSRDRESEQAGERERQRDRPARWQMSNNGFDNDSSRARTDRDRDVDNAVEDRQRRDHRQTDPNRERRGSPDDRRARTPPRNARADDGPDRGHVLSRKATFDGIQPPTGPRRQDPEANLRSVRGGGWQTVRPGSRPERNNAKPSNDDRSNANRNGRDSNKSTEKEARRAKSPVSEPPAPEPARAEPGEAYESIHQVGEGTYGQVFKARSEKTGALVALKKIRMDSEKDGFPVTAMREIKLLQALRHENIVRLHEMMVTRGSIYMVFEYMEHDLTGILAHPQVQFTEGHLKSLAMQLFSGLDYLHRKAVLHRDLKGSNSTQQPRSTEASRFWSCPILRKTSSGRLHKSSCHTLVSTTRAFVWRDTIWVGSRHVGCGMYLPRTIRQKARLSERDRVGSSPGYH